MPQEELALLLQGLGHSGDKESGGPGMDCSIVPLAGREGLFLVSTHDFFYPLVEDPYLQGRIACANVLSDLYSMGVPDCATMLMTLGASRDMAARERHIVTREMIRGFSDLATKAGTRVTGGQTVLNPWPIIGGVASAICSNDEMIMPIHATAGDVLVLTKPLGTQLAVNAHQWLLHEAQWSAFQQRCNSNVTSEHVLRAYAMACESMSRLNRNGALLMRKYGAHCATDVTGFGIMGHAQNLAGNQTRHDLLFLITLLPFLQHMLACDTEGTFGLSKGISAETSGGLLVALKDEHTATNFMHELQQLDGQQAWIVGRVEQGKQEQTHSVAVLDVNYQVVEV